MRKHSTSNGIEAQPDNVNVLGRGDFLNKAQIAQRLGVSIRTIEARTADGTLPAIKLGRLVRYHGPTVEQHLLAK